MGKRRVAGLAGGLALVLLAALVAVDGDPGGIVPPRAGVPEPAPVRAEGMSAAEAGAFDFVHAGFGSLSLATLETSALPFVPVAAMLALEEEDGAVERVDAGDVSAAFARHGFLVPERIANAAVPLGEPRARPSGVPAPLGVNVGTASRLVPPLAVTVMNMGCAACHAGPLYGPDGEPDTTAAWIGSPNTALDLERYTIALFGAMRRFSDDERLWPAIDRLFPALSLRERLALRTYVLPVMRERIAALDASLGRALPFSGGLPGATNGLDALHRRLDLAPGDEPVALSAFNSIPELEGRAWRTRLLNTGAYVPEGADPARAIAAGDIDAAHLDRLGAITAFFTVPSMGTTPEVALAHAGQGQAIMRWVAAHEAQPWPGPVDARAAARGAATYAERCASCHGSYAADAGGVPRLLSFPNWIGDVGTDGTRAALFGARTAEAIEATVFGEVMDVVPTGDYAAPPLEGLWTSAPYLHNGSVPTLWHLMRPDARPDRFEIGGHALDMVRVGVGGRARTPHGRPVLFDTQAPGLSNAGHAAPFEGMDEAGKDDLLEFLKTL